MKDHTSNQTNLDFNNTATAFGYKSNKELRVAKVLFSTMQSQKLVNIGSRLILTGMKLKFPINWLIRKTLFKQFVGGEVLKEVSGTLEVLAKSKVLAILDYGAEGKEDEVNFEKACNEFLHLIPFAGQSNKVPFVSIKITALGRFDLLKKINLLITRGAGKMQVNLESVSLEEDAEWAKIVSRVDSICQKAAVHKVGVLIDAEESWIQESINLLADRMMRKYNRIYAVVFNTIQFYNVNSYSFLQTCIADAAETGYILGLKIVRGAYMEKERERATRLNYPCPIQPDKEATDSDFNKGLVCCFENLVQLSLIIASHNEVSNLLAVKLLYERNIKKDHPHIHFSQLFGMSDHITFNLAEAGYSVSKYLPYGPLNDVMPYLMRRAQENTSVAGQTTRELLLINTELKRRKSN